MKQFLVALTLLMGILTGSAQHFSFMGIPLDGSANAFVKELASKGFTYEGTDDGQAFYKGRYYDHDVVLNTLTADKSDQITAVSLGTTDVKSIEGVYQLMIDLDKIIRKKYNVDHVEGQIPSKPYKQLMPDYSNIVYFIYDQNGAIGLTATDNCLVITYVDIPNTNSHFDSIEQDI